MAARVRLGDLLIKAGMITQQQLDDVLALQAKDGRRLGTLLVEAELVTETQVTQILSQQLAVPWVSLYHIDFSRQLLNLVPREVAESHCLVPIFVRRVRGIGECLYVAMDDPSNERAQEDVQAASGLPVRAMIAPPSDIKNAIRVYYGGADPDELYEDEQEEHDEGDESAPEELSPTDASSLPPVEESAASGDEAGASPDIEITEEAALDKAVIGRVTARQPRADVVEDTPGVASSDPRIEPAEPSEPPLPAREPSMPPPKKAGGPRMIELTLLDGTTVKLPAKERGGRARRAAAPERPEGGDDQLTARDLVAALRAVSHGADASEILGENARWESMFAALLNLLLKKHLIADWEFVDEFRQI